MVVKNKAAWFAWGLSGMVIAAALYSLVAGANSPETRADVFGLVNVWLTALVPIAFGVAGALILSRQARNRIGWLLMFIAVSITVIGTLESYYTQTTSSAGELSTVKILATWFGGWGWWLLIGPLLLMLLVFPTGELLSLHWRWVVWLIVLNFVTFLVLATLSPEWQNVTTGESIPNPLGVGVVPAALSFEAIQVPLTIALVSTVVLCVLAVGLRYRRSGVIERAQLKWFLYACAVFVVLFAVGGIVFFGVDPPSWFGALINVVFILFPVSIGIAILRYRLFDIDVIIRRTLTYALVTALLLVVFFGSVILLQRLFAGLTGSGQNEIVTVLSTLAIAALFVPLRNWIQNAIDKRFNRKKYDAQKVLSDFANTVRDETDLEKLTARLMQVVDETMEPKSVTLWLKTFNERRSKLDEQHKH